MVIQKSKGRLHYFALCITLCHTYTLYTANATSASAADMPCEQRYNTLFVFINGKVPLAMQRDGVANQFAQAIRDVAAPMIVSRQLVAYIETQRERHTEGRQVDPVYANIPTLTKDWELMTIIDVPGFVLFVPRQWIGQQDIKQLPQQLGLGTHGLITTTVKEIFTNTSATLGSGEEFAHALPTIFFNRRSYATSGNYCAAPAWNLYIAGHGKIGVILEMAIKTFTTVLLPFFNDQIKTHVFAYNSCTAGASNLTSIYGDILHSFHQRKAYNFHIAFDALADIPVRSNKLFPPQFKTFTDLIAKSSTRAEIREAVQYVFPLDTHQASKQYKIFTAGQYARIRWAGEKQFQPLFSSAGLAEITDIFAVTHHENKPLVITDFFKHRPITDKSKILINPKDERIDPTTVERILISTPYTPCTLQLPRVNNFNKLPMIIFARPQAIQRTGVAITPQYRIGGLMGSKVSDLLATMVFSEYATPQQIFIDKIIGTDVTIKNTLIDITPKLIRISWSDATESNSRYAIEIKTASRLSEKYAQLASLSTLLASPPIQDATHSTLQQKTIAHIIQESDKYLQKLIQQYAIAPLHTHLTSKLSHQWLRELYRQLQALNLYS